MTEVIIGSEIESHINILDLRDVWKDRSVDEVREFIKFKGCKMLELDWYYNFSAETLERINEAIELAVKYDIYDIARLHLYLKDRWTVFIAVPRNFIVILEDGMVRISTKDLAREKKLAISYMERNIAKASFSRTPPSRVKLIPKYSATDL